MLRMATHSVVSGWRRIYDFIITIAAAVGVGSGKELQ